MCFYIFAYWIVGTIIAVISHLKAYHVLRFSGFDFFMCCAFMSWFWPFIALSLITLKKGY